MIFETITENNFILYAMKHYNNYECNSIDDFNEDLNRIKYVKRLLRKYHNQEPLKERLILNHLVLLGNVFGPEATAKILFFKIEEELWPTLKTFLLFLGYMQEHIHNPKFRPNDIPLDDHIVKVLREI